MLSEDNLTDRIYSHPELNSKVDYLSIFNTVDYDEVYFHHLYVDNFKEVIDFFKKSQCYSLDGNEYTESLINISNKIANNSFDFFKNSFKNQKKEILKYITTDKTAILMPFSTRNYATIGPNCIIQICDILIKRGYSILLCGEYPNPSS